MPKYIKKSISDLSKLSKHLPEKRNIVKKLDNKNTETQIKEINEEPTENDNIIIEEEKENINGEITDSIKEDSEISSDLQELSKRGRMRRFKGNSKPSKSRIISD